MICTSEFTFIHLHKTGGQSISNALLQTIPDAREIGYHLPLKYLPSDATSLPVIGVLRNPWDWYVSWYAFNNLHGVKNPLFSIVSRGKQVGFNDTIKNLVEYTEQTHYNEIMKVAHRSLLPDDFENDGGSGFKKSCLDEFYSASDGYYSMLANRMFGEDFKGVHLIQFENLESEFISTLKQLGIKQVTAVENILINEPKKNKSARGHYSQYYNEDLIELISSKERRIIEEFGYEFESKKDSIPIRHLEPGERVRKVGGTGGNFLKLGNVRDIEPLREKVSCLSEHDWSKSDRHTQFDIHKETQSVQLLADDMSHTYPVPTDFYDDFADLINPILQQLSAHFGDNGTFIRVLLARLKGKSEIKPHVDKGYSLINCNRLHIPLISNVDVTFFVGGESRKMGEGEIWEINNANVHAVTNKSDLARVHLIVDWTPTETLLKEKKAFRMDVSRLYQSEMRVS